MTAKSPKVLRIEIARADQSSAGTGFPIHSMSIPDAVPSDSFAAFSATDDCYSVDFHKIQVSKSHLTEFCQIKRISGAWKVLISWPFAR